MEEIMVKQCVECGKEIKEETDSDYCSKCDEMLDKQFESIEDNIIVYKELLPNEIDVLNKFEKEDIVELYIRVFDNFKEEGDLTVEQAKILNTIKGTFDLKEGEIGKDRVVNYTEVKKKVVRDECPDCRKKIKEEFSFCPYCGTKLKL
jgi:Zn finger protein HypA/HybF involved in hydrogenase expression